MKKTFISLLTITTLAAVVSCHSKKESRDNDEPTRPVFVFTDSDSLAVNELADQYIDCLNAEDYDAAAEMLYTVRNDSVFPLTDEVRSEYIKAMTHLPHYGFQKKEVILNTDLDNRVRVAMLLTEGEEVEAEEGIMNYYINPVKVNGQWYLTTFDIYAEGVGIYTD